MGLISQYRERLRARTAPGVAGPFSWGSPALRLAWILMALASGALLACLTPLQGALVTGVLIVLVTTLIEPLVGLGVALFLGLLRAYLQTEVPQVPAQIGQVFLGLALAVWVARGLARKDLRLRGSPVLVPLVIFTVAALLSLWDSTGLSVFGLPELLKWVQVVLVLLFISDHLDRRRLPWLLAMLIVIGLFQAGVGVWQFGLRGEGPDHFAILGDDYYRAYGTFEQPNPYAGYLGLITPIALGLVAVALGDRVRAWWTQHTLGHEARRQGARLSLEPTGTGDRLHAGNGVFVSPDLPAYLLPLVSASALILLAALGMSWSRGAWVGFGAALLAMTIALPRRSAWGIILVAVIVLAGVALYGTGLLPSSITARLTGFVSYVQFQDVRGAGINDANYSVVERFAHWQAALEMFRHNPWLGVGFGAYEAAYRQFALINWPYALGHAHNYYLTVAAESGIIGLVTYAGFWIVVFGQTWRATRRTRGLARGVAVGLLGSWTHLSVHNLLDNLYVNNVHLQIGVLLGLLAVLLRQAAEEPHSP